MAVGEGRVSGGGGGALNVDQVPPPSALLLAVTSFVNMLLQNCDIDKSVRQYLFGASLTALSKPGGGIRPIAVGVLWRRLVGKVAVKYVSDRATAILGHTQLGFGIKGGAEAAAHAARRIISELGEGEVFVKLDFKNAFNNCRRDTILESVAKHFPEILPFVFSSYGRHSHLFFGESIILSQEGIQQGDPLGPLLFCLALHDLLQPLCSDFKVAFLDDVTIAGDLHSVLNDINCLVGASSAIGLSLNDLKSEVVGGSPLTTASFSSYYPNFKQVKSDDVILLGAPLHVNGLEGALRGKCEDLSLALSRIKLLPSHDSLYLLKNIFAIPKLLYIMRTAPSFMSPSLLLYDDMLSSSMSSLFNVSLSPSSYTQASLPVRLGGLGIRSAVTLAPSAFLASLHSTAELVKQLLPIHYSTKADTLLNEALLHWHSLAPVGFPVTPPPNESMHNQRAWDHPLSTAIADHLLYNCNDITHKARLNAVRSPWAGDWLQAVPATNLGLHLDDASITISLALRLGANTVHSHTCSCGTLVTPDGHHGLSCTRSAGRHYRHSTINNIIHLGLESAGIRSRLEPSGLMPSTSLRPDGVTLLPWKRGVPMIWDFTCPDTMAPSHLHSTCANPGSAANGAEDAKCHKYSSFSPSYKIIPVAIETMGSYGTSARSFVGDLGSRITRVTGDHRATLFLRQRISLAMQRGNACSVLGTQRHMAAHDRLF